METSMHPHEHREPRPIEPTFEFSACLDEMRMILFQGNYTSESRIELLLDRIESRR